MTVETMLQRLGSRIKTGAAALGKPADATSDGKGGGPCPETPKAQSGTRPAGSRFGYDHLRSMVGRRVILGLGLAMIVALGVMAEDDAPPEPTPELIESLRWIDATERLNALQANAVMFSEWAECLRQRRKDCQIAPPQAVAEATTTSEEGAVFEVVAVDDVAPDAVGKDAIADDATTEVGDIGTPPPEKATGAPKQDAAPSTPGDVFARRIAAEPSITDKENDDEPME